MAEKWAMLSGRVETGRKAGGMPRTPLPSPSIRACYTSSIYATANGSAPHLPLANEL